MQSLCADRMKTAGELLDHGVLGEGAEKLTKLHECGRNSGCDHWRHCISLVEREWRSPERSRRSQ